MVYEIIYVIVQTNYPIHKDIGLLDYLKINNISIVTIPIKFIIKNYDRISNYKDPLFVIGFVDYVLLYYKNVHNKEIKINDYPEYLKSFMFRNVCIENFKNAIAISKTKQIFIKPCGNIKKFTGCIIPSNKVN